MKPKIELKINNKAKFYVLQDLFIATLVFISLSLFTVFYLETLFIFYLLLAFYLVIFFIPTMILHYNYEKFNTGKIFILEQGKIIFDNKELLSENINKVTVYGTYQAVNKQQITTKGTHHNYFYIEILDKEGRKIYLTNLLTKKLIETFEDYFPNIKIEKKITGYSYINDEI